MSRTHIQPSDCPRRRGNMHPCRGSAPFLFQNTNGAHVLVADAYTDGIVSIEMDDFRLRNTCSGGTSM